MTTDTRTTLNLPAEMTRAIDNYWHSEQLRSRNEAIRELLAYALDAKLAKQPAKEQRRG
jgi:metal-responsive CopG/Arc/MetJ family transcriptional regulator